MNEERFAMPPSARMTIGCVSVFLLPVAIGATVPLTEAGLPWAVLPALTYVLLTFAAYVWMNEEHAIVIDDRRLRFERTRIVLGRRLASVLTWELPLERLDRVREVTTKTPSSQGGWNVRTVLQFPDGKTLDSAMLGGEGSESYAALVRHLRARLGDRFEKPPIVI